MMTHDDGMAPDDGIRVVVIVRLVMSSNEDDSAGLLVRKRETVRSW